MGFYQCALLYGANAPKTIGLLIVIQLSLYTNYIRMKKYKIALNTNFISVLAWQTNGGLFVMLRRVYCCTWVGCYSYNTIYVVASKLISIYSVCTFIP